MKAVRRLLLILPLAAIVGYALSGLIAVAPGEAVVVRRFGRVLPQTLGPGLHGTAPWGIDRRDRVRLDAVRKLELGRVEVAGPEDDPSGGEFLTGDRNLLRARAIVEFRVADPIAYVMHSADPEALLERLASAALARAIASRSIDAMLGAERITVGKHASQILAAAVDRAGLGLAILGVSLADARPPWEVQPDFDAAQAARSERDQKHLEAEAVADRTLATAQAEAGARLDRARAEAERTILHARAEASRFEALVEAARVDRAQIIRRLHGEALRQLLPGAKRTILLAPGEPIDLTLIPEPTAPKPTLTSPTAPAP